VGFISGMQEWFNICKPMNVIYHIRMKDATLSTDAAKAFDKIQHCAMIKILSKFNIERMYFNTIKAIIS
jgi:hypothetical protein